MTTTTSDYKVADIGLADFGRKEIEPGDWLRWEQEKHERLLATTT